MSEAPDMTLPAVELPVVLGLVAVDEANLPPGGKGQGVGLGLSHSPASITVTLRLHAFKSFLFTVKSCNGASQSVCFNYFLVTASYLLLLRQCKVYGLTLVHDPDSLNSLTQAQLSRSPMRLNQ